MSHSEFQLIMLDILGHHNQGWPRNLHFKLYLFYLFVKGVYQVVKILLKYKLDRNNRLLIWQKCDCNKVARHFHLNHTLAGCSPANLLDIFRTPFPKSTSGELLMKLHIWYLIKEIWRLWKLSWINEFSR